MVKLTLVIYWLSVFPSRRATIYCLWANWFYDVSIFRIETGNSLLIIVLIVLVDMSCLGVNGVWALSIGLSYSYSLWHCHFVYSPFVNCEPLHFSTILFCCVNVAFVFLFCKLLIYIVFMVLCYMRFFFILIVLICYMVIFILFARCWFYLESV